jgi:tetratricopeptide (TPR) repeat protein
VIVLKQILLAMRIPLYLIALLLSTKLRTVHGNVDESSSIEDLLEQGDDNLVTDDPQSAIKYYERGLEVMNEEEDSLVVGLSLYINLGTAYSSIGDEQKAASMYRQAILLHSRNIDEIVEESFKKEATDLAAQASFFLGMTLEEFKMFEKSADAYAYANTLDEYHWASLANLGSILQDHLKQNAEALAVYNKAFDILTQTEVEPTDAPENPKDVLSQLQYRIGLAISYATNRKCAMHNDPTKEVPCSEMAANAFNMAIEFNPDNEEAKHMLASVTADATFLRASNTFVTKLFEDYAGK